LVFSDNLDSFSGATGISSEVMLPNPDYGYFDFATGVVVYNSLLFSGVSVSHLSRPHLLWYNVNGNNERLDLKYTAHFGTRLPVRFRGSWRKRFDLMPQFVVQNQGYSWQMNYGLLGNLKGFTGGFWFRQDGRLKYDSAILMLGFVKRNWRATYSYEMTISGLSGQTGGSSEITLGFLLANLTKDLPFPFFNPYEDEIGK
jgi:type IX secretion system PorP/SprF family membrane protein